MKTIITYIIALFVSIISAQSIYHPEADAKKDISKAIEKASIQNKNVILQVGGNWCSYCIAFDKFIKKDEEIAKLNNENFVYYHLNYSKGYENQDILDQYNNPEKLGFPVLVVLNSEGNLIHTQETGSLEEGKSYNKEKVLDFFNKWSPTQAISIE